MGLYYGPYIECPAEWGYSDEYPSVFLAGGITNCPDWQEQAAEWLICREIAALNPRRANFPMDDPSATEFQIEWEFRHLTVADAILFWFTGGPSPQPIAQYELGRYAALGRPLAVGCDPAYVRRADVLHQMALARPEIEVRDDLLDTLNDVKALVKP